MYYFLSADTEMNEDIIKPSKTIRVNKDVKWRGAFNICIYLKIKLICRFWGVLIWFQLNIVETNLHMLKNRKNKNKA